VKLNNCRLIIIWEPDEAMFVMLAMDVGPFETLIVMLAMDVGSFVTLVSDVITRVLLRTRGSPVGDDRGYALLCPVCPSPDESAAIRIVLP
jgi:hypothetical protein